MTTTHRWVPLLLVPWFLGCATTHAVQLNTGTGRPIVYRPPARAKPVRVGQGEFVEVVSRLMLELPLSLAPEGGLGRVRLAAFQAGAAPRDVLFLDDSERRDLALSYALDSVWQGVAVAVNATINPVALKAMISSALCAYMLLVVAPEPVTKFIAIALTAYLVAYVGFEALWNMVEAFRQLRDESAQATSFAQLEHVGHRFGVVMGDNGARVLIMALLAAAGGRAGLAAKGPTLPGYAQAAFAAEAQAGFSLAAVAAGGVQSLSVSASGLVVSLAPAAVASVAWKEGGGAASTTSPTAEGPLVSRVKGQLWRYPRVIDPRTGREIPFPTGELQQVPRVRRVPWGAVEREAFIRQWIERGYPPPRGGWDNYDIHHIHPRELGGTNDFWNLVPVERGTHQQLFNAFWREFIEGILG